MNNNKLYFLLFLFPDPFFSQLAGRFPLITKKGNKANGEHEWSTFLQQKSYRCIIYKTVNELLKNRQCQIRL
jgi:hypothetical protein